MRFKNLLLVICLSLIVLCLYACGKKTYEVKFNLNYDNAELTIPTQKVKDGEKATEPITPSRDGYEFKGWYEDKEGTKAYDFSKKVTKSITLYAKWEQQQEEGAKYYLAGSFNNYSPNDENYRMEQNENGLYTLTVELTDENRDNTYDGHYYKVTNGSWDADGCWGVDSYYIDPAPVSPTGGGLGSIWHWANGTLTVTFNPETKEITDVLVMDEDIIEKAGPGIYGEFNSWAISGDDAFILTEIENNKGNYYGYIEFAEAGESDFTVFVSLKWFDDQWGQRWGVHEQYKFDGTPAGMGNTEQISYEAGKYLFVYDSDTKITTYYKETEDVGFVHTFVEPRIYGKFNGWLIEGEMAYILTDDDEDGIYHVEIEFDEAGESDFTIVLSKLWFDDEWGQRWGAFEQYKLDGTPAGMGDLSTFNFEVGVYVVSYNSNTKVTTINKK